MSPRAWQLSRHWGPGLGEPVTPGGGALSGICQGRNRLPLRPACLSLRPESPAPKACAAASPGRAPSLGVRCTWALSSASHPWLPDGAGGQARLSRAGLGRLHLLGCSPVLHKAVPSSLRIEPKCPPSEDPCSSHCITHLISWGALVSTRHHGLCGSCLPEDMGLVFLCTAKSRPALTPGVGGHQRWWSARRCTEVR